MTREQAVEVWEGMYIDEAITEYNHYVDEELSDSDLEIWKMDCLDDLVENVPPMDLIRMVVYGDVKLTDDYFVFDRYQRIKTIHKDDIIDYIIDNIDDEYLIEIAEEYKGEEDD